MNEALVIGEPASTIADASNCVYERDIARRWYALAPRTRLPLSDGASCLLLFAGLPGGSAGPDVRDAILAFPGQRVGDVEFHIRASDWYAHQHHLDARYNNVILHVVLVCDMSSPPLRQDGTALPTCSLNDLGASSARQELASWPCQHIIARLSDAERARVLRHGGLLRCEQKAHTFVEHLHNGQSRAPFGLYDVCLILAVAEGLGYGRDRAFFRAAGARLLGLAETMPEPLGRANQPAPLDAGRLSSLRAMIDAWRVDGAWNRVRGAIETVEAEEDRPGRGKPPHRPASVAPTGVRPSSAPVDDRLRAIFTPADISASRADILICNVVLPFAWAIGLVENDAALAAAAREIYLSYPDLPSNRVTRAMTRQLQLAGEPSGACQQQGLHYIYQQTCQEKRCEQCIAGRWMI